MMQEQKRSWRHYLTFFLMIGVSMVLMYILTYLNSYDILGHAWFSETRLFMTLIMGGVMMLVMFAFMHKNYQKKGLNAVIVMIAVLFVAGGVFLVRSQITVSGVDYMEAMIPHHSIAILTSQRAQIIDLRVRQLADEIIQAQEREIKEMMWLINDIKTNGSANSQSEADQRPVPDFSPDSD